MRRKTLILTALTNSCKSSARISKKRLEYEAREKAVRDYNQGMYEAEQRGEQRGIQIGEQRGEQRVNDLYSILIQANRFSDLERSIQDVAFRKQLIEEFDL